MLEKGNVGFAGKKGRVPKTSDPKIKIPAASRKRPQSYIKTKKEKGLSRFKEGTEKKGDQKRSKIALTGESWNL